MSKQAREGCNERHKQPVCVCVCYVMHTQKGLFTTTKKKMATLHVQHVISKKGAKKTQKKKIKREQAY